MPVVQCPTCRATADLPHFEMGRKVTCGVCESAFIAKNQFDFRESQDNAAGIYNRSRGTDPAGGVVCLFAQFLLSLGIVVGLVAGQTPLMMICIVGLLLAQFSAVMWVASNSRGRGAETPVWCLVVLFFPCIGLMAYLAAAT